MNSQPVADKRPELKVMYVGLLLTVVAALVPLVDLVLTDIVGGRVRAAYPDWPANVVATERNAIVGWLVVSGLLGVGGWLMSIRGVARARRWARPVAASWFLLGAALACLNLTVSGEEYDIIVPPVFGALTVLPVLAGLVAIVHLWRRPGTSATAEGGRRRASAHRS